MLASKQYKYTNCNEDATVPTDLACVRDFLDDP